MLAVEAPDCTPVAADSDSDETADGTVTAGAFCDMKLRSKSPAAADPPVEEAAVDEFGAGSASGSGSG